MPTLSVVVLTKNEETQIRACLETVAWADEIVIVDDFSTDKTLDICRAFTDKIYQNRLDSFSQQRRFGTDRAQGAWVLHLDADERLTGAVTDEINAVLKDPAACSAYMMPKTTFFLGAPVRHCGWSVPVARLFQKGKASWDTRRVHEALMVDGPVGLLRNRFEHHSYRSIAQFLGKLNRYTSLEAEDRFSRGIRFSPAALALSLTVKPAVAFLRKWVVMGGVFDGARGFLISVFTAMTVFFNAVKLWELQETERRMGKSEVRTGI